MLNGRTAARRGGFFVSVREELSVRPQGVSAVRSHSGRRSVRGCPPAALIRVIRQPSPGRDPRSEHWRLPRKAVLDVAAESALSAKVRAVYVVVGAGRVGIWAPLQECEVGEGGVGPEI